MEEEATASEGTRGQTTKILLPQPQQKSGREITRWVRSSREQRHAFFRTL